MNTKVSSVSMDEQKSAARKNGAADFIRETRQEIAKVTWPDRKETLMTTVTIVAMALLAGVFFLAVDSALGFVITHILAMNS